TFFLFITVRPSPIFSPFPYTTLFRSVIMLVMVLVRRIRALQRSAQSVDKQLESDCQHHRTRHQTGYWEEPFRQNVPGRKQRHQRSEEHTSELQSLTNIVCRLLLEKKK